MLEADRSNQQEGVTVTTSRRRSNSSGEVKREVDVKRAVDVDKAEEATIKLAIAKSLEEKCKFCDVVFPSAEELQLHYNFQHVEQKLTVYEERTPETEDLTSGVETACVTVPENVEKDQVETETGSTSKEEVEQFVKNLIINARAKVQQQGERKNVEEELLRDEIQQLKNSIKAFKTVVAEKDQTIQSLEAQILKLEEKNKKKEQECSKVKKNLMQHRINEKEFKEKAEKLESENSSNQRTITQLNLHLEHLQTTIDMSDGDDDEDHVMERTPVHENGRGSDGEQANKQGEGTADNKNNTNNRRSDTVKIMNYGGGVMSVENMEKLLGLHDVANLHLKKDFHITVQNDSATVKVPKHLTKEIMLFNDIDINGKKLKVELIESLKRYCYYFRKGRCENGNSCRFMHEPEPCRFFQKGKCTKDPCEFSHDQVNVTQSQPRKKVCKYFRRGRCDDEQCAFEHPICHSFRDKIECRFGRKCRFVCYKDQDRNNVPDQKSMISMNRVSEQRPAAPIDSAQQQRSPAATNISMQQRAVAPTNSAPQQRTPAAPNSSLQQFSVAPTNNALQQHREATATAAGSATKSQVNYSMPTGMFSAPQGSSWGQQLGEVGTGTNNSISFLGQKVEGLERTVSHLLQMLKPAYCPPHMPQIQVSQ